MTLLTKTECAAMRGIAILGIMLHNFCHWLPMAVKENEYTFSMTNMQAMFHALDNPCWNLPIHLLSFFGHYGVPVFLFLSAYGLTMKYELGGGDDSTWAFIGKHIKKLWLMMIVGFALFICADRLLTPPHHYDLLDVVSMVGMFGNLIPDPDHVIWPGPFWFFGLMAQFYILYRLCLYRRPSWIVVVLIIVCTALQMCCPPESETLNRLRYNFIGGMLPFGWGILYARGTQDGDISRMLQRFSITTRDSRWWLLAALTVLTVLIAGCGQEYALWYVIPLLVCQFTIYLVRLLPAKANVLLAWVGGISSAIFVCHPATRKLFIAVSRHGDIYTGLLLYIVATLVVAYYLQQQTPFNRNRWRQNP